MVKLIRTVVHSRNFRALMAALFMALTWSIWGYYANHQHGESIAVQAGATQGTLNFIFNLIGVYILEFMFGAFSRYGVVVRSILTIIGTFSITSTSVYLGHRISGTPEIFMTILPPILVALIFSAIYLIGLVRLDHYNRIKIRQLG